MDESPWQTTRERVRESITEARKLARRELRARLPAVTERVVEYVFDEDGFYEGVADKLIEGLPIRRRATGLMAARSAAPVPLPRTPSV
jgi:hypothetical protein